MTWCVIRRDTRHGATQQRDSPATLQACRGRRGERPPDAQAGGTALGHRTQLGGASSPATGWSISPKCRFCLRALECKESKVRWPKEPLWF